MNTSLITGYGYLDHLVGEQCIVFRKKDGACLGVHKVKSVKYSPYKTGEEDWIYFDSTSFEYGTCEHIDVMLFSELVFSHLLGLMVAVTMAEDF